MHAMNLEEARADIARRNAGDLTVSLHENAAASTFLASYYTTEGRGLTRDARPRETSRQVVDRLAREWRTRDLEPRNIRFADGEAMPMPRGILPTPLQIEASTGIPIPGIAWPVSSAIVRLDGGEIAATYRANDAARSNRLLREMNAANARYWGTR